jgi:hypothetical protein
MGHAESPNTGRILLIRVSHTLAVSVWMTVNKPLAQHKKHVEVSKMMKNCKKLGKSTCFYEAGLNLTKTSMYKKITEMYSCALNTEITKKSNWRIIPFIILFINVQVYKKRMLQI